MLPALILGAVALAVLMDWALVVETLNGRFADPDDAMRLVEIRDWMAGQPWFDMTAMRLDPPLGSFMHWSRLVDLPTAALIRLFALVADPAHAERLAIVVIPTLWLAALFAGMARLATVLLGRAGRLPAILATLFSGATLVQFGPGRIGHHAPETVALVFAVAAAAEALDPRRARAAALSGALVALALAMSLETMPFLAMLAAILVGFWVWRGRDLAPTIRWFGCGLLVALPGLFLVAVAPARWGAPVCDAFSAAHLGAGMIGAGGLIAASLARSLGSRPRRLFAVAALAAAVLLYVVLFAPACLRSPFAAVDPLVRDLWLSHVVESQGLLAFLRERPATGAAVVCPLLLGLAGCVVAAVRARGVSGQRFAMMAILAMSGLALSFWQIRVLASVTPIALCGGLYLAIALADRISGIGAASRAALACVVALAFTSTAWAVALPDDRRSPEQNAMAATKGACLGPEALRPLASLAPGAAVAPIDSGAHLLEATRLAVFAAPYHRNNDGNRYALDVFLAPPAEAEALLAARTAAYVVTCPGMVDMARLAARAPDGLAARLLAGDVPDFLRPLPVAGTPYRVYAVQKAGR